MTVKLSLHLASPLNSLLDKRCEEKSMTKSAFLRKAVALMLAATEVEGRKVVLRDGAEEKEVIL
ncbi:hypothetical protein [Comamonas sp.]|uniref:hypothetical protein n=1 Tax=Comamonas sp. TaxID=34028 RepID=UPI002FCA2F92